MDLKGNIMLRMIYIVQDSGVHLAIMSYTVLE